MKTLEIQVPEEVASRIEVAAQQLGVSVGELVVASVHEKLERASAFDAVAQNVLAKNADLYQRLS